MFIVWPEKHDMDTHSGMFRSAYGWVTDQQHLCWLNKVSAEKNSG